MKIYDIEKQDGLSDQIAQANSIAYTLESIEPGHKICDNTNNFDPDQFSQASLEDLDVHKTYSILVTTNWNANDDVFDPNEVLAAKNTPVHKPTNLNHDEKQIVGNIAGCWAVDDNYNLLDENEPHDYFHLLVASVVYRHWKDPELKERAESLIKSIKAEEMKVSMECLFSGFDYALKDSSGDHRMISRSSETAFLTKHLRAYGGRGEYQGYKVGRVLRNITFSGKGHVLKPANKESIMFNSEPNFNFTQASKQNFLMETNNMSDVLEKQVAELKSDLAKVTAENEELKAKAKDYSVKTFEDQIASLKSEKEVLEKQVATFLSDSKASETSMEVAESKIKDLEAELAKANSELEEVKAKEKAQARKSQLVEAGLSNEEAEAKLETLANVSDEAFNVVAETIAKYMPKSKAKDGEDKKEDKKEDKTDDAKADEVLDNVKDSKEGSFSVASELEDENELESTKAEMAAWVSAQ